MKQLELFEKVLNPLGMTSTTVPQEYTHQKRPYRAMAIQFNETNVEEVMSVIRTNGAEPHEYGEYIMIRFPNGIEMISIGSWVVVGENGDVKCYSNDVFHIKYEIL
jgi:hypothetical protein